MTVEDAERTSHDSSDEMTDAELRALYERAAQDDKAAMVIRAFLKTGDYRDPDGDLTKRPWEDG